MKTKLICLLAVLTIISSFFVSCTKDNPTGVQYLDTANFKYPFTIGSTWSYERVQTLGNIRPDSLKNQIDTTPSLATTTITISHDTTINGVQTRCFLETYTQDSTNWYSRVFYANSDSGLIRYGSTFSGGGLYFPSSPSSNIKFLHNGNVYNSINELFISYGEHSIPKYSSSDTVYIDNPPANCIKYPILIGIEWFYKRIDNNTYVNKKYLGFENILVNNNIIDCVKTERKWIGLGSNSTDYLYDYHSKYGQMKRDYYFKDCIATNEFGDTLGFFDIREIVNVTSYNIVNP